MAGTKAGGLKAREQNLANDPDHYKKIGQIGGKNGKGPGYTGGFAHPTANPQAAGAKGGRVSRRGKSTLQPKVTEYATPAAYQDAA